MIQTIMTTGSGFWDPLMWLCTVIIVSAVVLIVRSRGESKNKEGTKQSIPFFSGNVPKNEYYSPENLYWGFVKAMDKYYRWLRQIHTGIVNDYIFSFVILMVIMLLAALFGGLAWT